MRILIVDDDEALTRALARMLRLHVVVTTSDAHSGIELVHDGERTGDGFDVVLSDETMPGLTGRQLFVALREHATPPILILMTGDVALLKTESAADGALIKPFRYADLMDLVRRVQLSRSSAVTTEMDVISELTAGDLHSADGRPWWKLVPLLGG